MDMSSFFASLPPGMQPGAFPSARQVESDARKHATKLFEDWRILRKIVDRHEERIRTRWAKKSYKQKKTLLLQVSGHTITKRMIDSDIKVIRVSQ
jgi:hypothetical protein